MQLGTTGRRTTGTQAQTLWSRGLVVRRLVGLRLWRVAAFVKPPLSCQIRPHFVPSRLCCSKSVSLIGVFLRLAGQKSSQIRVNPGKSK